MNCEHCQDLVTSVVIHKGELWCWACHNSAKGVTGLSASVITDEIPGGLEVKHAICNPDGTPKKYYSKSAIKQAAYEAGWTIGGETPKPNPRIVEADLARREAQRSRR